MAHGLDTAYRRTRKNQFYRPAGRARAAAETNIEKQLEKASVDSPPVREPTADAEPNRAVVLECYAAS